jgi:hypothetical protein
LRPEVAFEKRRERDGADAGAEAMEEGTAGEEL